jgi:hypothetical protein
LTAAYSRAMGLQCKEGEEEEETVVCGDTHVIVMKLLSKRQRKRMHIFSKNC